MTYAVSITEADVMSALRAWVLSAVQGEVVQGFTNRVSTPKGSFVVMSGLVKRNLSTNMKTFTSPVTPSTVGELRNTKSLEYTVQLDVYGPASGDDSTVLTTAFTNDAAWSFFNNLVPGLAPLFMEDPRQSPIVTGEQQYDQRWTLVAHLNFMPSIVEPQESATEAVTGIIDVDATYPL